MRDMEIEKDDLTMLRGRYGLHRLDRRNGVRWGRVDISVFF